MSFALVRWSPLALALLTLQCGGEPSAITPPAPSVAIVSPVSGQSFPVGEAITVRFTVSGTDSSGMTPVSFQLGEGSTRVAGVGRVVAFIDASGPVAEARSVPSDANPFTVPDGTMGNPATLLTAGRHTLRLELRYNDGTVVSPQRSGDVSFTVQ